MNSREKWNRIVDFHKKYFRSPESTIQSVWENVFVEILGYSRLEGEVERHRSIYLGSTERVIPDVIVKNNDNDLFVVELKQHNLPFSPAMEGQLFSYLKQLRDNIGVLVCDKLYLYNYEYAKKDNEQLKIEIPFTEDNTDGIKFVEIFSKGCFTPKKVKDFVLEKNRFMINVKTISQELTLPLIMELITQKFAVKYSSEEIQTALNSIEISLKGRHTIVPTQKMPVRPEPIETTYQPIDTVSTIRKSDAILALRNAGVSIPKQCTFASLNKNGRYYWANPDVSVLLNDWWIILNDGQKRELHCFMVPGSTYSKQQFNIRSDRPQIDFEVIYDMDGFIDKRSKISFAPWRVKTIKY